jgi:hypothetical protein
MPPPSSVSRLGLGRGFRTGTGTRIRVRTNGFVYHRKRQSASTSACVSVFASVPPPSRLLRDRIGKPRGRAIPRSQEVVLGVSFSFSFSFLLSTPSHLVGCVSPCVCISPCRVSSCIVSAAGQSGEIHKENCKSSVGTRIAGGMDGWMGRIGKAGKRSANCFGGRGNVGRKGKKGRRCLHDLKVLAPQSGQPGDEYYDYMIMIIPFLLTLCATPALSVEELYI